MIDNTNELAVYRRLDQLEQADRELTKATTELTISVRLMTQAVETLSRATDQNGEMDKRLTRVESAYGALKLLGGGAALSIVGLAVTAIFGAR